MYGKKVWALFFLLLLTGLNLEARKKAEPKNPPPNVKAQSVDLLKERLKWLDLRFEILQKDSPPQTETGFFRVTVAEAKNLLADNKLADAESKITAAEDWLRQNEDRYFFLHKQAISEGKSKEDPAMLWAEAEKFWSRETESFMAGDKDAAGLFCKAGFAEGELAVEAAIASEMTTAEKVGYCLKLADRRAKIFDTTGAEQWKGQAKRLIEVRVEFLSKQLNWCLSGTIPECELITVRQSEADCRKARKLLDDGWKEINDLVKTGNEFYPGKFTAPDLSGPIAAWNNAQDEYFGKLASEKKPEFKDFEAQQAEERAKQMEVINKYNRFYCQGQAYDISQYQLKLQKTEIRMEDKNLVLRILLENNNSEPVYKPRLRLCGGIVSEELDLGYPRFPAKYQASFSVSSTAYILEETSEGELKLPAFWALLIFEDSKGNKIRVKAVLN
jgi:hypothetical protein